MYLFFYKNLSVLRAVNKPNNSQTAMPPEKLFN